MRFPHPTAFDLTAPHQAERISQLADARCSLIVVDTLSRVWGIAATYNLSHEDMAFSVGGYAFVGRPHHRLDFICCGNVSCNFDGFEWKTGKPTENLEEVGLWMATFGKRAETGNFNMPIAFEEIILGSGLTILIF